MRTRAAGLVLVVAALAGCGGNEGGRSSRPLSHAELVERANAGCMEARGRADAAAARLAALRRLHPPLADQDTFAHLLAAARKEVDARSTLAVAETPDERADATVSLAVAAGKLTGYARRLGAEECAERAAGTLRP